MKPAFLFILVFCVLSLHAQKEKTFKEKFVKIDMSKFPIAEFPQHAIAVSGTTVVQRMYDSVRVGFTFVGKDNAVATLTFAKPVSMVLQTQIDRMYKHEYKKDGTKILFVLKKLRYASRSGIASYQYTKFCADSYVLKQGTAYKPVCSMNTVLVVTNGNDIGSNIENALRVLLRQTLFNLQTKNDQQNQDINFDQFARLKPQPFNAPIFKDTGYREGVYVSFNDFLANTPSATDYEMITDKNKISIAVTGKYNKKDTLQIWGLCKNGELFMQYEGLLVPIVRNNDWFIIKNYDYNTKRNHPPYYKTFNALPGQINGFSVVPIAFDIINLISGSKEPKPILVRALPYITDKDKQPLATCIDMETGEFTF